MDDLQSMTRKELQARAKSLGIPANGKTDALVKAIFEEQVEEATPAAAEEEATEEEEEEKEQNTDTAESALARPLLICIGRENHG